MDRLTESDEALIAGLSRAAQGHTFDSELPPQLFLDHLAQLQLPDAQLEILFGSGTGLSLPDIREKPLEFWHMLLGRMADLLCKDQKVKKRAEEAVRLGASPVFWFLVNEVIPAEPFKGAWQALAPVAVRLALKGLERLCGGEQR